MGPNLIMQARSDFSDAVSASARLLPLMMVMMLMMHAYTFIWSVYVWELSFVSYQCRHAMEFLILFLKWGENLIEFEKNKMKREKNVWRERNLVKLFDF